MKSLILFFLIGLSSLSYVPEKAISYARKYCDNYNTKYNYYEGYDGANFVSQWMVEGGQDFDNCVGLDSKCNFVLMINLRTCLIQKGWRTLIGRPKKFKAGYPFFGAESVMIATEVKDDYIKFCRHSMNRCDEKITEFENYLYFYLPN